MMPKTIPNALALAATIGAPAISYAVTVDFTDGELVELRTAATTEGVWREEGVDVEWVSHSDLLGDFGFGFVPSDITPSAYTNLSESYPGADPFVTEHMVVTRTDGGLLALGRRAPMRDNFCSPISTPLIQVHCQASPSMRPMWAQVLRLLGRNKMARL